MSLRSVLLLACCLTAGPLIAQETTPEALPSISFTHPQLFPEAAAYDASEDRFFVSSLTEGTVYEVLRTGEIRPFTTDDRLILTLGISIDHERGRLLVTNLTRDNRQSALAAYDLETGEPLFYADLAALFPARVFTANDVTIDMDGNAYVTDSRAERIYKVDVDGNAEIFLDRQTDGLPNALPVMALNGIVYHPDGYLLSVYARGIQKIPLDNPGAVTNVTTNLPVGRIDGLALTEDGRLLGSDPSRNRIIELTSSDDFTTAVMTGIYETGPTFPTDVITVGNQGYALDSYINLEDVEEVETYALQPVRFTPPDAS